MARRVAVLNVVGLSGSLLPHAPRLAALGKANERLREGRVQTARSERAAGCRNGAKTDSQTGKPCN